MPSAWHFARMSARQRQRGRAKGKGGRAGKAMRALVAPRNGAGAGARAGARGGRLKDISTVRSAGSAEIDQ